MKVVKGFLSAIVCTFAIAALATPLPPKKSTVKKPKATLKLPAKKIKTKVRFDESESTTAVVVVRPSSPPRETEPETKIITPPVQMLVQIPVQSVQSTVATAPTATPSLTPIPVARPMPGPTPGPTPSPSPHPATVTTIVTAVSPAPPASVPTSRHGDERAKMHLRTSYVNARYSDISPELQNGATTIAIGVSRQFTSEIEGRALLEFGHGMDQEVNMQSTRFTLIRADLAHTFTRDTFAPIAGIGLGHAQYLVRSQRESKNDDMIFREHAKGSAIFIAPNAGVRINVLDQFGADLVGEYLVITGSASALGGLVGSVSVWFFF